MSKAKLNGIIRPLPLIHTAMLSRRHAGLGGLALAALLLTAGLALWAAWSSGPVAAQAQNDDAPAVDSLRCIAETDRVAFLWDAPEWSGGEASAYDYRLTLPDGREEGMRLSGFTLVYKPGSYQLGKETRFRIRTVYDTVGGGQVVGAEAELVCYVGGEPEQETPTPTPTPTPVPNRAPTVASPLSDVSGLEAGATQDVSLSGVFDDADSDALTVTATSSDAAVATVSVSSDGSALTVTAKARGTATITVTADDGQGGTVEDAFDVSVATAQRPRRNVQAQQPATSSDATLSALVLLDRDGNAMTLRPPFDPQIAEYGATVITGNGNARVRPTANDAGATVTVDGQTVTSGSESLPFLLGINSPKRFAVVVTAADGTIREYGVTATYGPRAVLRDLTISPGTLHPRFASNEQSFRAWVPYSVEKVRVTPTNRYDKGTITVNGKAVTSGQASEEIELTVGETVITVKITAPDDYTSSTHTITVSRASESASSDATLSALAVYQATSKQPDGGNKVPYTGSAYPMTPAFQSGVYDYRVRVPDLVPDGMYYLYVTTVATTTAPGAKSIVVSGLPSIEEARPPRRNVVTGEASGPWRTRIGLDLIKIDVTSLDGSGTSTYRVVVEKGTVDAPKGATLTPGDGSLTLAWEGSSERTAPYSYLARWRKAGETSWLNRAADGQPGYKVGFGPNERDWTAADGFFASLENRAVASNGGSHKIAGLDNGTEYEVQLRGTRGGSIYNLNLNWLQSDWVTVKGTPGRPPARALTITPSSPSREYGGTDDLSYTVDGLVDGDSAGDVVTGALSRASGNDAGTYTINMGTLAIASSYAQKYALPSAPSVASYKITPKAITAVSGVTVNSRPANGTTTATFDTSGATGTGVLSAELSDFRSGGLVVSGSFSTTTAGTHDVSVTYSLQDQGSFKAGNYTLSATTATLQGKLTEAGCGCALMLGADAVPAEGGPVVTVTAVLGRPAGTGGVAVTLTAGGTATIRDDYNLSSTTVNIVAGATAGTAIVTVVDDALDDDGETIILNARVVAASLTAAPLTLTITDNDDAPTTATTTTPATTTGSTVETTTGTGKELLMPPCEPDPDRRLAPTPGMIAFVLCKDHLTVESVSTASDITFYPEFTPDRHHYVVHVADSVTELKVGGDIKEKYPLLRPRSEPGFAWAFVFGQTVANDNTCGQSSGGTTNNHGSNRVSTEHTDYCSSLSNRARLVNLSPGITTIQIGGSHWFKPFGSSESDSSDYHVNSEKMARKTYTLQLVWKSPSTPLEAPVEPAAPPKTEDYDTDDDGLIEVSSLAQLDAMRWDVDGDGYSDHGGPLHEGFPNPLERMGCPQTGCIGYELAADLDFDTNGNGRADSGDDYWNGGYGWLPIGIDTHDYSAVFEGNGHVIRNLYIDSTAWKQAIATEYKIGSRGFGGHASIGLFEAVAPGGIVRNVGLESVSVSRCKSSDGCALVHVGGLAGENRGEISGSYVTGVVSDRRHAVGGLVGTNHSSGVIAGSYATASVTGTGSASSTEGHLGGLVGKNDGIIKESYATGALAGKGHSFGGLVGDNSGKGQVRASYASGDVDASGRSGGGLIGSNSGPVTASYASGGVTGDFSEGAGGLIGSNNGQVSSSYSTGSVSNESDVPGGSIGATSTSSRAVGVYWDTQTSGLTASAQGAGKTTAELQAPTGYTGIYAGWNVDLDGDGNADDPWDFGKSCQYPVLKYGGLNPADQRAPCADPNRVTVTAYANLTNREVDADNLAVTALALPPGAAIEPQFSSGHYHYHLTVPRDVDHLVFEGSVSATSSDRKPGFAILTAGLPGEYDRVKNRWSTLNQRRIIIANHLTSRSHVRIALSKDEATTINLGIRKTRPGYPSDFVNGLEHTVEALYTLTVTRAGEAQQTTNRAPTVSAPFDDVTISRGSGTRTVSLSGVFSDADHDALTVTAASSDERVATVSVAADYSTLTLVVEEVPWMATITVTADDGNGGIISDTFTVTVTAAPGVSLYLPPGHNVIIVNQSGTRRFYLDHYVSYANRDTINATSSDEAVATVSVADDRYSTLTVTAKARGTAKITITSSRTHGVATLRFTVTVKAAPTVASPLADVSGLEVDETQEVALSGVFTDADNDSLTITAASSDETKATVSVAADHSSLTLTGVAVGTATITVTARDSDGNTVSDTFDAPVARKYNALIAQMYEWRNAVVRQSDGSLLERCTSHLPSNALSVSEVVGWRDEHPSNTAHVLRWNEVLAALGADVPTGVTAMTVAESRANERRWTPARWVRVTATLEALEVCRKAHTDRWDRALLAFGETVSDGSLTAMTATEAQALAGQSGGERWVPVAAALREIEAG